MRVQTSSFFTETSRAPHQPPAAVILMHWSLMWLLFNEKQASIALLSYYRVIDLRWRMSLVEVNSFTQVINPFIQILKPPWLPSLVKIISLVLFPSLSYHLISCPSDLTQFKIYMNHLIMFHRLSFTIYQKLSADFEMNIWQRSDIYRFKWKRKRKKTSGAPCTVMKCDRKLND